MDLGLQDRVYLVAGGSRGLGYAAAEALVAEGARVVVSGRDAGAAAGAARALGPGRAVGVAADNADPATPGRLIAAAREEFARLDGALISVGGPPRGPATDVPDEAWQAAFGSIFLGAVRLSRALAAELTEGGAIAFVLSSSVRVPIAGAGHLQRAAARPGRVRQDARGRTGPERDPGERPAARLDRDRPDARARAAPGGAGGQHPAAAHRQAGRVRPGWPRSCCPPRPAT